MPSFRALNPPQILSVQVYRQLEPCVHEFPDDQPIEIPADHTACVKMLRRSSAYEEV